MPRNDSKLALCFRASKTQANVQHGKIPTPAEAARTKAYWANQLNRLQEQVEA